MSNLLGLEQPGKCGCLKSLFIEIYMILDAYMASHGYCPARSYTGSRWMIEMAFIKVHDGLKLATHQNLNSPHVCCANQRRTLGLKICPTLGVARWFGVSYSWQTGILDELQRLKHSGPLEHP